MIRATLHNGKIQPVDPLPATWEEGRQLLVQEAEASVASAEVEEWFRRVETAAAAIRPEDHAQLLANLEEADRLAKEQARREMGLAE